MGYPIRSNYGHASTSDICVPDTWLRRQLHALASASRVQGPLVVFCSVVRFRNQFQKRRPLNIAPLWSAAVIVLRPSRMHTVGTSALLRLFGMSALCDSVRHLANSERSLN